MDQNTQATPATTTKVTDNSQATDRKVCILAYSLMLAAPLLWFTPFIAVVIGYFSRGDANALVKSHYHNIIKTFWTGFWVTTAAVILYSILFLLMFSGVGFGSTMLVSAGMLALTVWIYIRMIKGLLRLLKDQPWA